MTISDSTRWFEISAVVITGLFKFILFDLLNWHFLYVTSAVLFLTLYIIFRYKKNKAIIRYWGFTGKNLKITFYTSAIFTVFSIGLFVVYALIRNYQLWNIHIIFSLLTYPVWGLIQQFLIMSLVAGNLKDMNSVNFRNITIIVPVSILFSAVHFPSLLLVAGTFILAIFYCIVFLRYRNLYPLGLFHGWIGAFFYFYVLNRDPWAQFIEMLK